jgi:hypothetical protein
MSHSTSTENYREPARDIPVLGHWDVIVAGGGPAGCAAAWAAARSGARTLLVEKSGHLGGQTVDSLVCAVLSTNGVDFQGVWHDWVRALRKRRGAGEAMNRSNAMMITTVYPESVKYAWDDLLSEAGVELLHHVHVCGAIVEDGVMKGLLLDTRAEREGRAQAWEAAEVHRRFIPGCENSYLLDTSNQIGVRSTRRVQGLIRLTDDDAWHLRKQANSIARSSWDIDIWPADSYTKPAVRREDADYKERHAKVHAGDYFDIPYGCIVAKGVDNLLMAGQCLSASHVAESSLRIQQTCMATGQAAGTAAAMSIEQKLTPRELPPAPLLARLARDRDIEPAYDLMGDLPVAPGWQEL